MKILILIPLLLVSMLSPAAVVLLPDDGKLYIICFGAHPDDCELRAGGPMPILFPRA